MPLIRRDVVARVAEAIKGVRDRVLGFIDYFTDSRFYPRPSTPAEDVAMYFLVMVSMDHRLSRPGRPFEAIVEGERFHGADLLYRLGMLMFERDPSFFTAERLSKLTLDELRRWLCIGGFCPPDLSLRLGLLRDLGSKLLEVYGGSAFEVIWRSRGFLLGGNEPGFIQLLGVFRAYNDPVWKKSLLLAKFLERRGLLSIRDEWSKRVPVDNHASRIALRLGLVELEDWLSSKLRGGLEFTAEEDVLVRLAIREAWHLVSRRAGIDDFILDDALWSFGRRVCVVDKPKCRQCLNHPFCIDGVCVFAVSGICPWASRGWAVNEHKFLNTWWY